MFNPWLPRFQKLGEFNLRLDNSPQADPYGKTLSEKLYYLQVGRETRVHRTGQWTE